MDFLLFAAVGILAVLGVAVIVALGWLLDDRAHARQRAGRDRIAQDYARQWYRRFEE